MDIKRLAETSVEFRSPNPLSAMYQNYSFDRTAFQLDVSTGGCMAVTSIPFFDVCACTWQALRWLDLLLPVTRKQRYVSNSFR